LFNLQEGKRLFGLLTAGREMGSILAGFCTPFLLTWFTTINLFAIAMIGVALGFVLFRWLSQGYAARFAVVDATPARLTSVDTPQPTDSLGKLLRDRYVLLIVVIYSLWVLAGHFIENIYYTQVSLRYPQTEQLASFIGLFMGVSALLGLLTQIFLASRLLTWFKLSTIVMITPTLLTLCALVFATLGNFVTWPLILIGIPILINLLLYALNGIDTLALNLLYQPMSAQQRTRVQTLVDSILYPITIGLSGVILLVLTDGLHLTAVQLGYGLVVVMVGWAAADGLISSEYPRRLKQAIANRTLNRVNLTQLDPASLAIFQQSLTSPHAGVVLYALETVADLAPQSLASNLPALLEHPNRAVRQAALDQAEQLGLNAVAPVIRARLKNEGSLAVQGASVRTLAILSTGNDLDEVIAYLDHPQVELRQGALVGLLRSGDLAGILAAGEKLSALFHAAKPAERILAAQVIGAGASAGFYRPLLKLLNDDQPQVQRAAINAAGKLKQPKLWPVLIQQLAIPQLRSAASEALVAGGSEVVPWLKAAMAQSIPTPHLLGSVARICGQIGDAEAIALLQAQLTYPHAQVRAQVLGALMKCGYQARQSEQALLHHAIETELQHYTWTLAVIADLGEGVAVARLKAALQHSLSQQVQRIFGWLALIHDPALIRQVQSALRPESAAEQRSYALEILQVTLAPTLKALLWPLVEPLSSTAQATRLLALFPQHTLPIQARLGEIILGATEWLTPWSKVCALYAVVQLAASELLPDVRAALADPDLLVQQAAAWALHQLAPHQSDDLPFTAQGEASMLMLVEKVICLKTVDFLADSPEEVLAELAALLEEQVVKADEVILAKGDTESAMYLIVSGQVRLYEGERLLTTLGENEFFGELMLLNPIAQPLTIRAAQETHLLRLTQAALRQVIEEHSAVAWQIIQRLAQRVQRTQSQARPEQARTDLLGSLQERLVKRSG
jgi:CRP-like cAMP-binding protein